MSSTQQYMGRTAWNGVYCESVKGREGGREERGREGEGERERASQNYGSPVDEVVSNLPGHHHPSLTGQDLFHC